MTNLNETRAKAEDEYFSVRPEIDNNRTRQTFRAGFDRAWRVMILEIAQAVADKVGAEDD